MLNRLAKFKEGCDAQRMLIYRKHWKEPPAFVECSVLGRSTISPKIETKSNQLIFLLDNHGSFKFQDNEGDNEA